MKATLAGVAGFVAFVLVIVVPAAVSTTAAALTACLPTAVTVRGAIPASVRLDAEQQASARTIVSVVVTRRLPSRAAVIAVATALQESSLRNLTYGDLDSLGLFQQRPSQGWGAPLQVMDPGHATHQFLDHLQQVPRWPVLPLTQAAQAVQRSAFPDAYARWEPAATVIVNGLLARPAPTGRDPGADRSDRPGLLVMGDRQLRGTAAQWPATYGGGVVTVDIRPERRISEGLQRLRQRRPLPGTLVLSLGSQERPDERRQLDARIASILRVAGPDTAVFWVTGLGDANPKLDEELRAAARPGSRVRVIDVAAAIAQHPNWTDRGGLTPLGAKALVKRVLGEIGPVDEPAMVPTLFAPGCDDGLAGYSALAITDCGFQLPRQNPRGCQDAVRWALAQVDGPSVWYRRCLNLMARAYGYSASGVPSAAAYWQTALLRLAGDPNPPPGALVFWDTGEPDGHVALSAGGGMVVSNDIGGPGTVSAVSLTDLTTQWNARYLGWAPPFFPLGI